MADSRGIPFWIDTFSKVVMPLATLLLSAAIFAGTSQANNVDREIRAKAQCRDGAIQLLGQAEATINLANGAQAKPDSSPLVSTSNDAMVARAQSVHVAGQFLERDCDAAGLVVPLDVQRTLCSLRQLVPNTDVQADLLDTADDIARKANASQRTGCKTATQLAAANAQASLQAGHKTPLPVPDRLILYVQYPRGAPKEPLVALKSAVETHGLAGIPTTIPGFEAVNPPATSSLRCLKVAECAIADNIARDLGAMLHTKILVLDLSGRYNARSDIRPGTIELWLASQDRPSENVASR